MATRQLEIIAAVVTSVRPELRHHLHDLDLGVLAEVAPVEVGVEHVVERVDARIQYLRLQRRAGFLTGPEPVAPVQH